MLEGSGLGGDELADGDGLPVGLGDGAGLLLEGEGLGEGVGLVDGEWLGPGVDGVVTGLCDGDGDRLRLW